MNKKTLSRRDFLKLILPGIGAFLTACMGRIKPTPASTLTPSSTSTSSPTSTPTSTSNSTSTATETPIPSFKLLTPENNAILSAIGKVTFSWEQVPSAVNYRLEITLPTEKIASFVIDITSYTRYLESLPLGGIYFWRVIAQDANGNVIFATDPFSFSKPEYYSPTSTPESPSGSGDAPTDIPTMPPETEGPHG
jgi:hypothetical protein